MPRPVTLFRTSLAVFLVVIILLALHWLGWLRPVESALAFVFEPVARGMRIVTTRIGNSLQIITSINHLAEDNKNLALELEQAKSEIARLREVEAEVVDLRERLEAPLPQEMETLVAGVIGHDGVSASKRMIINKGERDGVVRGSAVISAGGTLIGVVEEVLSGQAEILLVTDDGSVIPARIGESRATGLVKGELGLGLNMTDIPQQDRVNKGDLVVTSGLGDDIPKGLVIGQVETVEDAPNALFQVASVRPFVEVSRLEYVHVVTKF